MSPSLDIRPLIVHGPAENRVDLVFFSDGCEPFPKFELFRTSTHLDTTYETNKFFEDAMRLAVDVSQNQTFYTVKPLLNFWGAFTPSEEVNKYNVSLNHFVLNFSLRVVLALTALQKCELCLI